MVNDRILVNSNSEDSTFLRKKTIEVKPGTFSLTERKTLIERMRRVMRKARGVGLSANQIGLPYRVFVAEVPGKEGEMKFYAIFNPVIEKHSKDKKFLEEGCLSVPGTYGEANRSLEVLLRGIDKNGKALKIRAWGLLAHVFQHEVDHLDGKLFIDQAINIHEIPISERLVEREGKLQKKK